ncbi:MAG: GTP-binding protein Obg/CgtA, partial [Verrucomicrobiaceae bacterium]|nr:GTP-binding protein Obg/CgtA [Verrucomicrobiaceae bacterium]
ILVFVVDTAGTEGRDPIADIQTLRMEIKLYDSEMAKRPWVILCNKMDLPEAEEHFLQIKERFKRVKIFPISADTGLGLDKLRKYLDDKIGEQVKW